MWRASLISDVSYYVNLAILKGDTFIGSIKIKFNLSEIPTKSIGVDFVG